MQPVSGDNYYRIAGTAAATATITDRPSTIWTVVVGNAKTGTVELYDSASGTNSNYLMGINNNVSASPMNIGAACKKGITVVASGTTDALVIWS